jgi:hypothetical protein
MSLFHRWIESTGVVGFFSWLSGQARNAASLDRSEGASLPVWHRNYEFDEDEG